MSGGPSTAPTRAKVFGERNTGTGALVKFLAQNYAVELMPVQSGDLGAGQDKRIAWARTQPPAVRQVAHQAAVDQLFAEHPDCLGWKHCAPVFSDRVTPDIHFFFCVKNPYTWLLSLFKRPYDTLQEPAGDLMSFLTRPWLTVRREKLPPIIASPILLWSIKMQAYARFAEQARAIGCGVTYVRSEDTIADPLHVANLGLPFPLKGKEATPVTESTKDKGKTVEDYRAYYLEGGWKAGLSREAARFITANVTWSLGEPLGYTPLDEAEFGA